MADGPGDRDTTPTVRHTLRSFKHRPFRLFIIGQFISLTGTWMQGLAQAWLLYRLTQSAFMLGAASAALLLPSLVFSLYGGMLADRFSRQRLLIAAQTLAMVQAFVLAALTLGDVVEPWHVLALASMLGVVQALELPVRHSFLAALVPRADLANAIALNASLFHGSRLIGPALAGVLVVAIGEGWVFLVNGMSYIAVLAVLGSMRLPRAAEDKPPSVHGLFAGFRYVRAHPPVRVALLLVAAVALFGSAGSVLLPVFAVEVYEMGANRLGMLMGAIGAGALVGALWLAGRRDLAGQERRTVIAAVTVGVGLTLFALSPSFLLALPLLALVGYGITNVNAATNAYIQHTVPDNVRGRVMSLYAMALHGAVPLGSLAVGMAADRVGAPLTIGLSGAVLAVVAIFFGRRTIERR